MGSFGASFAFPPKPTDMHKSDFGDIMGECNVCGTALIPDTDDGKVIPDIGRACAECNDMYAEYVKGF